MPVGDIRPIKAGLREHYKSLRRNMPREIQEEHDERIARRVAGLWQYKRCRLLLTYVSTPIEVDTRRIIERALADGKRVAVPRASPVRGIWSFISSAALTSWSREPLECWNRVLIRKKR